MVGTQHVRLPPKHYPRGFKGAANRGPAKAQRSGFGGERRSSGTTELLPRKAKRRMWSLRRRGTPFSPIFLQTKKDGATGGRWFSRAVGKKRTKKDMVPRSKCPWGTLPWKIEALSQPPNFRLQIKLVNLSVPTFSPHMEQYNRVRGSSAKHATDGPKSR